MTLSKRISVRCLLIIRAPGLLAFYEGFVTTHPNLFVCYMIWDTIESHHKMQHSPAYGPFSHSLAPMLAGDISITHFQITDPQQLKMALEMPVTLTSHMKIAKDKVAGFLKEYPIALEHIEGELNGHVLMYAIEDAYVSGARR
jgi:hypothetical protein